MKSTRSVARLLACSALFLAACAAGRAAPARAQLNLPGRSDALPFSHGVLAGDTYYVAGTLGIDPATKQPPADVELEIRLLLDDVKHKLALAGMTMDDLVSVQIFCPDLALYDSFNKVYATYFTHGYPARSFLGSGPLLRGCRFEVIGVHFRRW